MNRNYYDPNGRAVDSVALTNEGSQLVRLNRISAIERLVTLVRESADLFLQRFSIRYPRRTLGLGFLVFIIVLTLFVTATVDALPNGDSALQAQQVENRDFANRSIHLGYYWLGALFITFSPLSTDLSLGIMNGVLGALSSVLIFFMVYTINRSLGAALLAVLLLISNYMFVYNSVYAEIYISQTLFLLLAMFFWLRGFAFPAALSFTLSFLITPTTALAVPAFFILRPHRRALLVFGFITLLISVISLLPRSEDYLFGGRGLLLAITNPSSRPEAVFKEMREVFYGFFAFIPLLLVGFMRVIERRELRPFGGAIIVTWLTTFVLGETTGVVPVQLPTYLLLIVVAGLGFGQILGPEGGAIKARRLWFAAIGSAALALVLVFLARGTDVQLPTALVVLFAIAIAAWVLIFLGTANLASRRPSWTAPMTAGTLVVLFSLNVFLTVQVMSETRQGMLAYKHSVEEMGRVADPESVVIGGFTPGILFEHYTYRESYTGRWINTEMIRDDGLWEEPVREDAIGRWETALTEDDEVWLLNSDVLSESELEAAGFRIEPFGELFRAKR